jgi:hypothetical protein
MVSSKQDAQGRQANLFAVRGGRSGEGVDRRGSEAKAGASASDPAVEPGGA